MLFDFLKISKKENNIDKTYTYSDIENFISFDSDNFNSNKFNNFIVKLYQWLGYKTDLREGFNDKGIDIIIENKVEKIAIQNKKWKFSNTGNVDSVVLDKLYLSMTELGIKKGIIICTNSMFSKGVEIEAKNKGIELIGRKELYKLVAKANPCFLADCMYKIHTSKLYKCLNCEDRVLKQYNKNTKNYYYKCLNAKCSNTYFPNQIEKNN